MVGRLNGMVNPLPFLGMMMAILTQTGNMVVSKVAMTDGMNKYVMVVYYYALSALILLPIAILHHRSERPPLTFSELCSIFLLALFGLASVLKKFPAVMLVVFYQIVFSTIQSAAFALFAVRDLKVWVLKLGTALIAILYQAVAATVIRYTLCTWCVQKAGPLFCAMFKPAGVIFTAVMGAIFLRDRFHLRSLVGAVIIVVGFYAVMWGKATEERKVVVGVENLESSCHGVPLLQNKT